MIKTIALYRLHNLVESHISDAVARKQAADAKKAKSRARRRR